MNKYSDRPDYELNLAVARHLGHKPSLEHGVVKIKKELRHGVVIYSDNFDPCNNPADAMPIIIENGISLIKEDDHYIAASTDVGIEGYIGAHELMLYGLGWLSKDKNPCRAAMEVFLMMKDVENEK